MVVRVLVANEYGFPNANTFVILFVKNSRYIKYLKTTGYNYSYYYNDTRDVFYKRKIRILCYMIIILNKCIHYIDYPCPLWSVRDRQPMYGEIGHTIMDLLAVSSFL